MQIIETMTRSIAAGGSTSSWPGAVEGVRREAADAVSLETVRETLETALEEELRVGEDEEVENNENQNENRTTQN